ncbi:uncharacterized protein THITE_35313 [Thermothielavioides terrestris NRRL 8126]|uniref:CDC45-like protein n=1 Tax=Thermothielavioides terrestris (strain ATCC 38088 / NRRL 8126) TaxID=578455 RepID=G2QYG7_THETT|nr:uncharacterized protein THITE_35313 [Thermothielavioides terrestris NRRL 8126]AEO67062.1 hypothetical protein THITE_35313 [Thermothielavioides terrestris NRRL 8126]
MYLPRALIAKLYLHLQNTRHPLSPPVLVLVALEPDALCACRILTRLFKHDYIPHKIQPVAGYADLERVGRELVVPMTEAAGGAGGVVVCLGVGGMADLGTVLGLEQEEGADGGAGAGEGAQAFGKVEVWVVDSHRPWNLSNVFGGFPLEPETEEARTFAARAPVGVKDGCIERAYRPGKGGIVVFDDGDIEEGLAKEREAYLALVDMPDVEDDGEDLGDSSDDDDDDQDDDESDHDEGKRAVKSARAGQKRKSWDFLDEDSEEDDDRPRQRRRSNSSSPIPDPPRRPAQRGLISLRDDPVFSSDGVEPPTAAQPPRAPSARTLRRRLLRLRRKHESVLRDYYRLGTSYSEPISSMMYSLASELGREDNDLLWLAIVGVTSMELYGRSSAGIALLRDEVRRLNPPEVGNGRVLPENTGIIPTTARSPEDTSIRLSPEPKFLLIRHWSLYDSMLHSPYLFSRLKTWSESGLKRLHKLLAKMGVSLVQCKQSYAHMDMMLKRELRTKLLKYASLYNLDELIPSIDTDGKDRGGAKDGWGFVRSWGWRATLSAQDVGVVIGALLEVGKDATSSSSSSSDPTSTPASQLPASAGADAAPSEEWVPRFWQAYDALEDIEALKAGLPTAQLLHRAIFATGTAILKKRQISHLRAFRMCVVKDAVARGPDAALFCHPGALTKLALWIGEALAEQEREATGGRLALGGRGTPLVVASLDEKRGVYVVEEEEDEDVTNQRGYGLNRFGIAFQDVVSETKARVRIDSFEHCVVEVKKEDLGAFLESLSMKAVVG